MRKKGLGLNINPQVRLVLNSGSGTWKIRSLFFMVCVLSYSGHEMCFTARKPPFRIDVDANLAKGYFKNQATGHSRCWWTLLSFNVKEIIEIIPYPQDQPIFGIKIHPSFPLHLFNLFVLHQLLSWTEAGLFEFVWRMNVFWEKLFQRQHQVNTVTSHF